MSVRREIAVAEWMAGVYREASVRGVTDLEVAVTFSREAAALFSAIARDGKIRPIGAIALVENDPADLHENITPVAPAAYANPSE